LFGKQASRLSRSTAPTLSHGRFSHNSRRIAITVVPLGRRKQELTTIPPGSRRHCRSFTNAVAKAVALAPDGGCCADHSNTHCSVEGGRTCVSNSRGFDPFSQLAAGMGVICTCYPAGQLMHRVSDRFVQQPRRLAVAAVRERRRLPRPIAKRERDRPKPKQDRRLPGWPVLPQRQSGSERGRRPRARSCRSSRGTARPRSPRNSCNASASGSRAPRPHCRRGCDRVTTRRRPRDSGATSFIAAWEPP
jgi:hypothetical protein